MVNNAIDVSIVIVCMNNLKNLYPCLDSIKKYTKVSYETLVVAYLFSKENLNKLRNDYPWVTIIESNVIRGFSENNNLALKQANGKYCYVLNDDTFMDSPVIDNLVSTFDKMPKNIAVVSPNIKYPDGRPQYCGRNKISYWTVLKFIFGFKKKDSQYINRQGIFETYNIMGAAFLIKTDIFKEIGYFDEYYFFCPEDIAVSTLLRERGYKCIVNGDVVQYHIQGGTWSIMQTATEPAHYKGCVRFYAKDSLLKKLILILCYSIKFLLRLCIWFIIYVITKNSKAKIKVKVYLNTIVGLYVSKTPKELFVENYNKIKS